MKQNRINKFFPVLLLVPVLMAVFGISGLDAQNVELDKLAQTAVMQNGRLKPLDTFADNIVKQLSGRGKFQGERALHWLARVLFTPEKTYDERIFLITNPEVLDAISINRQGKARDRYSFQQLRPGLSRLRQLAMKASRLEGKNRSFIDNEIVSLYNKLYVYQQLLASFEFALPHRDFTVNREENVTALGLSRGVGTYTYLDIAQKRLQLAQTLAGFKEKPAEERNESEKELSALSQKLQEWAKFYGELPLTILPPLQGSHVQADEKWHSPWSPASQVGLGQMAAVPEYLVMIRDFCVAYSAGDQGKFDAAVTRFNQWVRKDGGSAVRVKALEWEVFYNAVDPFYKSKFFYGFAVIFILLSFLAVKTWFYRLAFLLLGVGFLLHLWGTVMRMYIMQRPPVTNLYETFLFTGLITVLLGGVLEFFKKKNIGVLTGGLAGLVMLMIAGKYAMEGDTMGMLVAVLDSNFWLAFHVITIILGYAGVVLSGFLGHLYILQRIFLKERKGKKDLLKNTFQAVYGTQAFGFVFTFLGTVLGGIWADQSWGRFWGWDPKENGALVVLLWSAILFHAKKAGWLKENGWAFGTVIGVIFIALAWFGVNLLGVGLHSYGFTSGIARSLFLFIGFEILFMFVTAGMMRARKKQG